MRRSRPLAAVALVALLSGLGAHCGPRHGSYQPPPLERSPPPLVPMTVGAAAGCGDGVVAAPAETCDDGNAAPGDGCDSCHIEAAFCAPEAEAVVRFWRCSDSPSQCELASCRTAGAGADCPPELATRLVSVVVRRSGFVDLSRGELDQPHVLGPGLDCSCRESSAGRVCDPRCQARVATCASATIAAPPTSLVAGAVRWEGACSGSAPACTVRPIDDTAIAVWIPAAPTEVAGLVALADGVSLQFLVASGAPDGSVLVAGQAPDGTRIGSSPLESSAGSRVFVARLSPDGSARGVVDLGPATETAVHAIAPGTQGDSWVVTAEGAQENQYYASIVLHPRFVIWHFDATGRVLSRTPTGFYSGAAVIAATASGAAVVALKTLFHTGYGGDHWAEDGIVVLALDAGGLRAWQLEERPTQAERDELVRSGYYRTGLTRLSASGNDVQLEGTYANREAPRGLLKQLGASNGEERAFTLTLSSRGAIRSATAAAVPRPDKTIFRDAARARFAWQELDRVTTVAEAGAGSLLFVTDAAGHDLYAWNLPTDGRAPTGVALRTLDGRGNPVIEVTTNGPYTLGNVRISQTARHVLAWLAAPQTAQVAH